MRIRLLVSAFFLLALLFTVRQLVGSPPADAITGPELERWLEKGVALQLIDVREPQEYAAGHIPGALLIPLHQLTGRMGELDVNTVVVVVCRTGSRSAEATRQLVEAGFDARNLKGGMEHWKGPVTRSSAN